MKLPNADQAQIDREKIKDYLLDMSHPDGKSKANFFKKFGFNLNNWTLIAKSLRTDRATNDVVKVGIALI